MLGKIAIHMASLRNMVIVCAVLRIGQGWEMDEVWLMVKGCCLSIELGGSVWE